MLLLHLRVCPSITPGLWLQTAFVLPPGKCDVPPSRTTETSHGAQCENELLLAWWWWVRIILFNLVRGSWDWTFSASWRKFQQAQSTVSNFWKTSSRNWPPGSTKQRKELRTLLDMRYTSLQTPTIHHQNLIHTGQLKWVKMTCKQGLLFLSYDVNWWDWEWKIASLSRILGPGVKLRRRVLQVSFGRYEYVAHSFWSWTGLSNENTRKSQLESDVAGSPRHDFCATIKNNRFGFKLPRSEFIKETKFMAARWCT